VHEALVTRLDAEVPQALKLAKSLARTRYTRYPFTAPPVERVDPLQLTETVLVLTVVAASVLVGAPSVAVLTVALPAPDADHVAQAGAAAKVSSSPAIAAPTATIRRTSIGTAAHRDTNSFTMGP